MTCFSCARQLIIILSVLLLAGPVYAEKDLVVSPALKDLALTGYTRCFRSVTLTSEVAGKAIRVNYKTGDAIGDNPFIEIDPTFINLSIKNNKLQTDQMDSRIKSMKSNVHFLNKSLQRVKALRKTQNATEVKYDEAANLLNEAVHELEALKLEKNMLKLSHDRLMEEQARYKIFCFKGWVVTALHVEEGESVQAGMPLAEVSDYSTLVVPFSLSGEEVKAFRDLPPSFDGILDSIPVKVSIHFINPKFDENTRKLQLELAIKDYAGDRRGGLKFSTRIKVITDGILIPRNAVRNRFGNPKVALKATGELVPVMILGESGDSLIAAETDKLIPGTHLLPADNPVSGG
ncbi:MAG: HlyD family efflux transporter periplasmic adaptor subunit [Proteobacteria bacterium]|nr:HlyD family efflux transporter periplasmic adaptor subunit [Pseudomonadota bacterium]